MDRYPPTHDNLMSLIKAYLTCKVLLTSFQLHDYHEFWRRRKRSGRPRRPVLRESQNLDHLAEVAVNNLQQGEFAWTGIPRGSAEGNSEGDHFNANRLLTGNELTN